MNLDLKDTVTYLILLIPNKTKILRLGKRRVLAENILIQQYLGDGGQYQELNPVFVDKEINARLGLSSDFNSKSWIDLYS